MAVLRNISIILLLIIITRAPAVQLKTQSAGQTQGSQSQKKSPLDIQFYGVRPDNSDDILDAKGKKIDSSVFSIYSSNTWSANNLRRDFIFKLPETDDLFPFVFNISVILPGEHRLLRRISPMPIYPERISVQNCFVLSTEIPQTYSKSFFGLFNRKRYVDLVDVSFQYYYGPPGPAVFSFSGPFETDKTFSADGKKDYQMVVSELNEITNRGFPSSSFRLICPEMFSSVFSIFSKYFLSTHPVAAIAQV